MIAREGLHAARNRVVESGRRFLGRHGATLVVLVAVFIICARQLHRGHAWGDDFALYVRQSQSLLDGNIGQIISDNHFAVDNSPTAFSPYVYPWVWPLLLAPFIRLVGIDYETLKFIEIALFCGFLWWFHELIRVRAQRWVALGIIASMGTTVAYIVHTDHLLSEFPYLFAIALTLWWLDKCRAAGHLDLASRRHLIVLGLCAVMLFNIRREGLAIIPAVLALQALELRGRWRTVDWRHALTPYLTFVAGVVAFQLLLPSALAPDYEQGGLHTVWDKVSGPYKRTFTDQLGLPPLQGFWFAALVALVAAGMIVRLWRAPRADIAWVVFPVASLVIIGSAPNPSLRYLMAITPFGLYFGAQALASIPLPRRAGPWLAVAALSLLTAYHLPKVQDRLDQVSRQRAIGADMADGPESPYVQPAWAALERYTHQDDIVAFWKVRAMGLYTNRRGVQTVRRDIIEQRADFYLMKKGQTSYQLLVTESQGLGYGWTVVWEDESWILWGIPRNVGASTG